MTKKNVIIVGPALAFLAACNNPKPTDTSANESATEQPKALV